MVTLPAVVGSTTVTLAAARASAGTPHEPVAPIVSRPPATTGNPSRVSSSLQGTTV
jgi:hypothetical protein